MDEMRWKATKARQSPPAEGRGLRRFGWLALGILVVAQVVGFVISPPDADMGHLQKIMYVHVPAAWMAFIAFGIVFVAGLLYLWRGAEKYDLVGAAAAEIGMVLTALTLALGSIWGRPTWGVWWTWDPRITTTAILLLIFIGYLTLRSFIDDEERRARWSAVLGIFGFLNVPIVYMSVRWWRSLHQMQSSPETVDAAYAWGLRMNAIAFLLVLIYFVVRRYRIANVRRRTERLEEEAALAGGGVRV